jgi:hypothetical protein
MPLYYNAVVSLRVFEWFQLLAWLGKQALDGHEEGEANRYSPYQNRAEQKQCNVQKQCIVLADNSCMFPYAPDDGGVLCREECAVSLASDGFWAIPVVLDHGGHRAYTCYCFKYQDSRKSVYLVPGFDLICIVVAILGRASATPCKQGNNQDLVATCILQQSVTKKNKKKKKRSSIYHTQEGIGHGRQPAGQVEGEQQEGMWRSKGEKGLGGGEEPQHHQNTKPEQDGRRSVE